MSPACTACADTGVVAPHGGRGSDGPDACPACTPVRTCTWCFGSGEWVTKRQIVPCEKCNGTGER